MNGGRRLALVTGAARGIGAAIATRLLADGLVVFAADLPGVPRTRSEPDRVDVDLDVADLGSRRAVLDRVEMLGSLDVLVNNAGVFARTPLSRPDPADTEILILRVNADACADLMSLFAPLLRGGIDPTVVNIASVRGLTASTHAAAYSVSKAAVIDATREFAARLGPVVRVNAVAPGDIASDMSPQDDAIVAALIARIPLGRFGRPEEVADAVSFLASARSKAITGVVLPVDGGFLSS